MLAEAFVDPPAAVEELLRGSGWGVMQLLGTFLLSLDKSADKLSYRNLENAGPRAPYQNAHFDARNFLRFEARVLHGLRRLDFQPFDTSFSENPRFGSVAHLGTQGCSP